MTTPTGYLSAPLATLREMVAATAAFQSWLGVATEAAATPSVHVIATGQNPSRPLALIDFGPWERERVAVTNGRQWQTLIGSELVLYFRDDAGETEPDAAYDFCNRCGAVLAELETIAGIYADETLSITRARMLAAPQRIDSHMRDTSGDYYEAAFALQYSRQP